MKTIVYMVSGEGQVKVAYSAERLRGLGDDWNITKDPRGQETRDGSKITQVFSLYHTNQCTGPEGDWGEDAEESASTWRNRGSYFVPPCLLVMFHVWGVLGYLVNRDEEVVVEAWWQRIYSVLLLNWLKVRFFNMIKFIILKTCFMIRKVKDQFKTGYCKCSSSNCTM